MKKIILLVVAFMLSFVLISCDAKNTDNNEKPTPVCEHTEKQLKTKVVGACRNSFVYYECDSCGHKEPVDFGIACDTSSFSSKTGNNHTIKEGDCPACHTHIKIDQWDESHDACHVTRHEEISFVDGSDEFKIDLYFAATSHSKTEMKVINLAQYGACGGEIKVTYCEVCNENISLHPVTDSNIGCPNATVTYKNSSIEVESIECKTCGLYFENKDTITPITDCVSKVVTSKICKVNNQVIYDVKTVWYMTQHSYDTIYECIGNNCIKDGCLKYSECNICAIKKVEGTPFYNHTVGNDGQMEIPSCGDVTVEFTPCQGCNTSLYIKYTLSDCLAKYPNIEDKFIAEDGQEHTTYTRTCGDCGLVLYREIYTDTIDNVTYTVTYVKFSKYNEVLYETWHYSN